MENSTIVFILTLVIAFGFLRWLISPIPQSVADEFNLPDPATSDVNRNETVRSTRRPAHRAINDSMIEIVQALAPQLTVSQIRHSLQQTGSVEATVNQYVENGALSFPTGDDAIDSLNGLNESTSQPTRGSNSETLLDRYSLAGDEEHIEDQKFASIEKWGKDKRERDELLRKRKEDMILRARRRMKESLSNEIKELDI